MNASGLHIVDLASRLIESCRGRNCSRECLRDFIHRNYGYLGSYVEEHLDGRIDILVGLLDEMFSLHPGLCKSKIELKGYPI